MAVQKNVVVGAGVVAAVLVAGLVAWLFIMGNPYDAPVREISLKIDALAQVQLASGSTVADLRQKISLFDQELSSAATKIPAGKDEAIVRNYYSAALDFVKSVERMLDAWERNSVAEAVYKDPSAFTRPCTHYTDLIAAGSCMLEAGSQMSKARDDYKDALQAYISAQENHQNTKRAVADARDKASTVVSKGSTVTMSSFDQLLAK